jgi:hypothetical protein
MKQQLAVTIMVVSTRRRGVAMVVFNGIIVFGPLIGDYHCTGGDG